MIRGERAFSILKRKLDLGSFLCQGNMKMEKIECQGNIKMEKSECQGNKKIEEIEWIRSKDAR